MSEKSMHKDTSIDEALVAKHKLKKKKMQIKNAGVDIQIQGLDNNNNNNKKNLLLFVLNAAAVWPWECVNAKGPSLQAWAMKETFHNEITSKELVNKDRPISIQHEQIIKLK